VKKLNLTGRLVNKLRNERGWTQDELADRLQKAGWMISRSGLSKIESGLVYVHDFRLHYFADVFRVPAVAFVPTLDMSKPIDETLSRLIYSERRGLTTKPHKLFHTASFAASSKAA
jgi:transcriptional regulator with XRE-family HTH domain